MKITKNQYLKGFGIIVILLALVRCVFPSVAGSLNDIDSCDSLNNITDSLAISSPQNVMDSVDRDNEASADRMSPVASSSSVFNFDGYKHPIVGVLSYSKAFPDSNDVQLSAAQDLGVSSVSNREEAENRKNELVYIAASPYYSVDRLRNSIPYLVPRAAVLLNDIGRNFFDSLYVKSIPLHKFLVTSVLRTEDDLDQLRQVNHNVSENSCHLYGTTFDIGYNRYHTVYDPDGPARREVSNDTLKWVLSEVLRDLREAGRCYVKYEVRQGCFHITVK